MLESVKLALRIKNKAFDLEILELIEACKLDLVRVGIKEERVEEEDFLIKRAIITYCKANFGYDNLEAERFEKSYNSIRDSLSLTGEYNAI